MSIPVQAYKTKSGVIYDAMETARTIVANWVMSRSNDERWKTRDKAIEVTAGWDGVALLESITEALLESRGFDVEGCWDELEGEAFFNDSLAADVIGEYERKALME
jgi:hypothetical protein